MVVLAGWFGTVALVTGIRHDVPLIDDWTYAWAVEHFLRTGTFNVLDWSSAYTLSQALWGAAWSTLLGFSFGTLRLSTMVLSIVCCGALYLILRELGASTRIAFIGMLCLAVNPLFVFLSSSFMTDVPFIAFSTVALLCYVRAMTQGEPRLLWWAGAWSMAAFLTRQVGIVTPIAGLPLLLAPSTTRTTRLRAAVPLLVTWGAMAVALIAMRELLGVTSIMQRWSWNLYAWPPDYAKLVPIFLALFSFFLFPALLADASLRSLWRKPVVLAGGLVATALLFLVTFGAIPVPLQPDQTWSPFELGFSRALVSGELPLKLPIWLEAPARIAGLLASTLLLLVWWRRRDPSIELGAQPDDRARLWARAPLMMYVVGYLGLVNLLWMYNDRYYLALMPPFVALILGRHRAGSSGRLCTVALVAFAAIALVGTRDALRFNQAVRDASQSLIDAGVSPSDIDAGYAWNGWLLYAHPSNLAPGLTPLRDVPWVTSARLAEYVISKSQALEGYVPVSELSWRGLPWPAPNRLFVLKRADAAN